MIVAYVATPCGAIKKANPHFNQRQVIWTAMHIAKQACKKVEAMGYIPISPVLAFSDLYNEFDPVDREKVLRAGAELLKRCDMLLIA